ncbi:MAG: DUF4159 domain-containing protein [Geminicoccaceae bacterium]|nr:DUF4159 domain-containing protein [Geminicoccaceae bacterium]
MLALGPLAFLSPWLLLGLLGLPLVLILLRILPPSPRRQPFPPLEILRRANVLPPRAATMPWWLLLLRLLALAFIILACARPVLNPAVVLGGTGPLLVVLDDGWAGAANWAAQRQALAEALDQAAREEREVVLLRTAPDERPAALQAQGAAVVAESLPSLAPKPWPVDRRDALERLRRLGLERAQVLWLSDGLANGPDGLEAAVGLHAALAGLGEVKLIQPAAGELASLVRAPVFEARALKVPVERASAEGTEPFTVLAEDADGGVLARTGLDLKPGQRTGEAAFDLPGDLRGRIARIALSPSRSLGDGFLLDNRWRPRRVGILTPSAEDARPLVSDTYFIERALAPVAELTRGTLDAILKADPSVIVVPDHGAFDAEQQKRIETWIDEGGVLLRFSGPRLAAAEGDGLVPVPLRQGERYLGGTLSWSEPLPIDDFAADGPFAGLEPSSEATIRRQVLAAPGPDLAKATLASLADGTPIVTGVQRGGGWLILVHTSANTSWSDLALSGLFVDMLTRTLQLAQGSAPRASARWELRDELDAFGALRPTKRASRPVLASEAFAAAKPSPSSPPGLYARVTDNADGGERRLLNLQRGLVGLVPLAEAAETFPAGEGYGKPVETPLGPGVLLAALLLLLAETLATLWLRGLIRRPVAMATTSCLLLLAWSGAAGAQPVEELAQTTRLAYVETGVPAIDDATRAGLVGLTRVARQRTSVEMDGPVGIDLESGELALFPLIYWPLRADQAALSPAAIEHLADYMQLGGLVLVDTADSGIVLPSLADEGPGMRRLRELLGGMDLPPLVPLPADHVLTRSFYLLQDAPGRVSGGTLWVDQVAADVNDGVSSLVVGSNDWAGAWAEDDYGRPLLPVVPGGERQREMARRFGVNLVMYALTGNYKTDQVHIPALLERLGQ